MPARLDETDIMGQKFGRLTVEEFVERDKKCRMHNIKLNRRSTSDFKGVRKETRCSSYRASIVVGRKQRHLGSFKTAEEATHAYDEAARKYFGEFACVNFPLPGEQGCRERAAV